MAKPMTDGTTLIRILQNPDPTSIPDRVEDFLRDLGGPSWLEIAGQDHSRRRAVVALLHGNEPSSIRAVHAWLRSGREPAVDTVIYVGSVAAALADQGFAHRHLPGERDANRCYGPAIDDEQGRLAAAFTKLFHAHDFEALVDIHNNTGHNPAYGIGYGVDRARLNLSNLFADWYVHSDLTMHTLVEMSGAHCPSISVECGRAGDPAADAVALAGLERFLHLHDLGLTGPPPRQLRILQRPHRVYLQSGIDIAFANTHDGAACLTLRDDLDRHNFAPLEPGTVLGWVRDGLGLPLTSRGASDEDVATELFALEGNRLITRQPMIPIMMTTDLNVARSDCLFYAMAPAAPDAVAHAAPA